MHIQHNNISQSILAETVTANESGSKVVESTQYNDNDAQDKKKQHST